MKRGRVCCKTRNTVAGILVRHDARSLTSRAAQDEAEALLGVPRDHQYARHIRLRTGLLLQRHRLRRIATQRTVVGGTAADAHVWLLLRQDTRAGTAAVLKV